MNMVDDASGDTLARMGSEETIWAAAGVLRAWVKKYGVPVSLYTDWKNVYVREASGKEQLQGVVPVTQFSQMCQRLGIRIIAANSPQAGRVERNHGAHQDRLVKKMRLKKIQNPCRGEWISGEGMSARAQSAVSADPGAARELSSSDPAGSGVGGSVSSGNRASHRQRLGGAADNRYFQVKAQARRMRRPRAGSRCANGRTGDYRFAIAVGRWFGRRFQARFQFRQ